MGNIPYQGAKSISQSIINNSVISHVALFQHPAFHHVHFATNFQLFEDVNPLIWLGSIANPKFLRSS